jgi:hypothetical protein
MTKKKPDKFFKDWQYEEVEIAFGLTRMRTLPTLEKMTQIKFNANAEIQKTLEKYRLEVFDFVDTWNEDEYKFMFIAPFFKLVDFSSPYFKIFTQRPLSITYDNDTKLTSGIVEFMLAKGKQIPQKPHFFLQEYKPEKNRDNDPLGQLLIAMVAAQKVNQDDKPVYGIYINGRNWFLVYLEGKNYAVSLAYDITSPDIFNLFEILNHLRNEMEKVYQKI